MELKDFIKGTISDIAIAISELNEDYASIGLVVNPKDAYTPSADVSRINGNNDERLVKEVEFNLSISASDTKEGVAGIRINVLSAGINNETNNSTVSTVKFSIPVVYPGSIALKKND